MKMLVSSDKKEQTCYNTNITCQFYKYIYKFLEKKGVNACVVDFVLGNIAMGVWCDIKGNILWLSLTSNERTPKTWMIYVGEINCWY